MAINIMMQQEISLVCKVCQVPMQIGISQARKHE